MKIPSGSRTPVQLAAYRRSVTAVAKLLGLPEAQVSLLVARIEAGGGNVSREKLSDFKFLSIDQITAAEAVVTREHGLAG